MNYGYYGDKSERDRIVNTAQEYDKYMQNHVNQLVRTGVSIMAIIEECGCNAYEHIGNGYRISIVKEEECPMI